MFRGVLRRTPLTPRSLRGSESHLRSQSVACPLNELDVASS
jgi:hypothetical protein